MHCLVMILSLTYIGVDMKLNTARVAKFVGGDIVIQSRRKDHLFRGSIKTVIVKNGILTVTVDWLAKNDGGLKAPGGWTKTKPKHSITRLEDYSVSENAGRIVLASSTEGDTTSLLPQNEGKLNPICVVGLEC
jgi:hypothetical protein